MASVSVKIEGGQEIVDNLHIWNTKILNKVSDIIQTGAFNIMRDSVRMAPIDTGALRASIKKRKIDALTAEVYDGVEYGVYQEYGTRYIKAKPFMRPALKKNQPKIVNALKKAVPK